MEHALPVVKMFVEDWNSREVWDGRDWAGRQREGQRREGWERRLLLQPCADELAAKPK